MVLFKILIKYYGTKSRVSGIATPADWRPGDDVLIGPAGFCGAALKSYFELRFLDKILKKK